jgi:hypothetical protein
MVKFFLGVLFLSLTFYAQAAYKVYECNNEVDTFSCNSFQCTEYYKKILPKSYIDFNINLNDKIIQKNTYLGGLFIKSKGLENCMIVDKKNWQCVSNDEIKESMHNDIYQYNTNLNHRCAKLSFTFD